MYSTESMGNHLRQWRVPCQAVRHAFDVHAQRSLTAFRHTRICFQSFFHTLYILPTHTISIARPQRECVLIDRDEGLGELHVLVWVQSKHESA
jgi:hypothetical protein